MKRKIRKEKGQWNQKGMFANAIEEMGALLSFGKKKTKRKRMQTILLPETMTIEACTGTKRSITT